MKSASILFGLGLVALVTLAFQRPTSAAMTTTPGETYAECLQRCFDQYTHNLDACDDACEICDKWFLFFCVTSHSDPACVRDCVKAAKETYEACKAECVPNPTQT